MKKFTLSLSLFISTLTTAIAQQPVISSMSAMVAVPGTAVTISGTGFNAVAADNIVYFGATRATVTAASATALTVNVPVGATFKWVSVNNAASGLTGFSQYPFMPTYDNSGFVGGTVNFGSRLDFAGTNTKRVTIADLDGDGKSEMISSNGTVGSISVFRNTSTVGSLTASSFAARVDYACITGSEVSDVSTADIDGDGKPEIIVSYLSGNNISVFRNTTTAGVINALSFATRVEYGVGSNSIGVSVADFDGDGKSDIVVAAVSSASLRILRNTATTGLINAASFESFITVPVANAEHLAVGDVDGDGKPDIVTASGSVATVNVVRNNSTSGTLTPSSFAAAVSFATVTLPGGVALGDIDGDGKLDIVATGYSSTGMSILRNTATAGVIDASSFEPKVDFTTLSSPRYISLADFDGDGKLDIALSFASAPCRIAVYRNQSVAGVINTGSLSSSSLFAVSSLSVYTGIAAGDMDGDGRADVVFSNSSPAASVSVIHNNPIQPITGTAEVCVGGTTTLANATGGGTWSSANPVIATINTSGLVTGVTAGTVMISYNLPGGVATRVVTVSAAPAAGTITGTAEVCVGSNITLVNATTGGVWSSSVTAVGTVGIAGVVTGVAAGTTTISYAVTNACATAVATRVVTVNMLPDAITGTTSICNSGTTTLTTTTTGVTWSSADPTIATVGATTGVVTGVSAGTVEFVCYITATGCSRSVTVTVNPFPATITGATSVCEGATTTLSNATVGGSWSSVSPSVADVGTGSGVVTGLTTGTAVILYSLPTGCGTSATISVNAAPAAIGGQTSTCIGVATTLTNDTTGGVWASSDVAVATVDATTGIVNGVALGTTTISYTRTTGCRREVIFTVNAVPTAIGGTLVVCQGATTTLTNAVSGGAWSSATTSVATIDAVAGLLTGITTGTATISYTTTPGCLATDIVTVNTLTTPITGTTVLCASDTTTLLNATTGGTWTSADTDTATINATTGFVTAIAAGTTTITYTDGTGCYATANITVNPLPNAGTITGTPTVCTGSIRTLSSTATGGVWSSSNTAVATVGSTGIVIGVTGGTTTISYVVTNSCGVATASVVVTVTALPDTGVIAGFTSVCAGSNISLSHSIGAGTWSSTNTLAATIGSTGIVTGIDPGTSTISYTRTNVCGSVAATSIVTVNPLPAVITGPSSVCAGSSITLTSATSGGTWTSTHTTATIGSATGIVTGVNSGTARISYTLSIGCFRTTVVTVNTIPLPIIGTANVCEGATRTFTNATPGGVWISSNTAVAPFTTPTSGIVIGLSSGTAAISYALSNGCSRAVNVTVNNTPSSISGVLTLCAGDTSTLSSDVPGGTWVSSIVGRATVGFNTGLLTGINGGTARITYTTTGGCSVNTVVTINTTPAPITLTSAICVDATTPLSSSTTGGLWTSSNSTIAGVVSGTGVVAGVSAGTAVITYSLANGCFRTRVVTVNPLPDSIVGASTVCTGATTTLIGYPTGGTWTSSNTARAVVSAIVAGGSVTGISTGSVFITYSRGACRKAFQMTVNPTPAAISGTLNACVGTTTLLSNTTTGGTWVSANTSIATVGSAAGVVTGVSSGYVNISYVMLVTGCRTVTNVVVNNNPTPITGVTVMCEGTTTTLFSNPFGGTWSSSNLAVATVHPSTGLVSGLSGGTARITYRVGTGCISTVVFTVNPTATAGTVSGSSGVCPAATFSLTTSIAGGTWSVSTGRVSVSATGVVTGITAGTDTVKYTVITSCGSGVTKHPVTVYSLPGTEAITGNTNVCLGQDGSLGNANAGGIWSSNNTAVASIAATGIVTGVSLGTATISYTLTNICGSTSATTTVTVLPLMVDAGTINGVDSVCDGDTIMLSSTVAGGEWSSSNTLIAHINTAGVVTGVTPGTATVRYIYTGQCASDTTEIVIRVKSVWECYTSINLVNDLANVVNVYPNPTSGSFVISTPVNGTVAVYSLEGKLVHTQTIVAAKTSITLPSGLSSGIYVCRFADAQGNATNIKLNYQP